jgi:hypothetical protein
VIYRNVKTGAVIDVPSMLGGNWERIDGKAPAKEPSVSPAPEAEEVKPVKKTRKTTTKKTTK